jgi:HJR/Mrr/RecB family endonuclease
VTASRGNAIGHLEVAERLLDEGPFVPNITEEAKKQLISGTPGRFDSARLKVILAISRLFEIVNLDELKLPAKLSANQILEILCPQEKLLKKVRKDQNFHKYLLDAQTSLNYILSASPNHIDSLKLQARIYLLKGDLIGLARTEQALSKGSIASISSSTGKAIGKSKVKKGLDFEKRIQALFEMAGFQTELTRATGDGGIDLIAHTETPFISGNYIVQCKDWENPVGEPVIRDIYGLVIASGANKGIVITTGRFTSAAKQFAAGKPLELIDGEKLKQLMKQYSL